jgi:hypothetical protein
VVDLSASPNQKRASDVKILRNAIDRYYKTTARILCFPASRSTISARTWCPGYLKEIPSDPLRARVF